MITFEMLSINLYEFIKMNNFNGFSLNLIKTLPTGWPTRKSGPGMRCWLETEYLEADLGWFRGIVSGVVNEQKMLDPLIHQTLPSDWPLSRIDTLLRAILRCGAFELKNRQDVPAKVVISEYLEIAKSFFAEDEPRLVNGVLDRIARDLRNQELSDGKTR